ncbi:fimbrial protein [Yersinia nurmii]|uniref:Fimbrial protein n=1 Tax=Yersinia nurmii TaxID=685706 RepID=A0AAW7JZC2_9GAMM|nr:fimbrial protein [Yersinia nurmii]MDN0087041.1 fimbrial protein [Yersinia nurmii]CNE15076.1 putative mannose-resistant/Proteus-like fimbrial protein [Yersinia nurmii]
MNTKLRATILLASAAFASFSSAANAADGTINFTGTVIAEACTVSPASAGQTVALGNVSAKAFPSIGATAMPTKFDITLTSCPESVTKALVKFDGPFAENNTNLLALTTGAGVATGLGIAIYEADGTTLIPMTAPSAQKAVAKGVNPVFSYIAKYMSTNDIVTTGPANAVTQFSISYN